MRVSRATDRETNTVTVKRRNGEELSYDPRRLQGVTVYRDTERTFAEGDRIQMTAPYRDHKLANRELGTVDKIDGEGNLKLRWTQAGRSSSTRVSILIWITDTRSRAIAARAKPRTVC